jgi:hypothetical protein
MKIRAKGQHVSVEGESSVHDADHFSAKSLWKNAPAEEMTVP